MMITRNHLLPLVGAAALMLPACNQTTQVIPKVPSPEEARQAAAEKALAERNSNIRLQIFLDENRFGPGFIDGQPGEFTTLAIDAYNQSNGLPPGDRQSVQSRADQRYAGQEFTTVTVPSSGKWYVRKDLSIEPEDMAKSDYLGYRSLLEYMAERYHTTEPFLIDLNPGRDLWKLVPGDSVIVPNVSAFKLENIEKGGIRGRSQPQSSRKVVVDTGKRFMTIYDGNRIIAAFPITPGKEKFIHRGTWKIKICQFTPEFRWDDSMLEKGVRSGDYHMLPPGPNSPIGIVWNGLTKSGIGIHGTAEPWSIGRSESAGCIRLSNWDAKRFPDIVRPGAKVVVR